ncbi:hypothetical protein BH23ACT9_BH23ACT9_31260 [soil metagenome]
MPERPKQDDARQPTLLDPLSVVTDDLVVPDLAATDDHVVGGRYELRTLLGTGGMCDVWRAHDPVLDREVAIKRLLPRWRHDDRIRGRFSTEAMRVAKLNHPAIVGVLDAGEDAVGPFLVMDLVEGPSLAQRLQADGRLSVEESVAVGIAMARALGSAHRAGIVHRDVKPGNILLDPRNGARLTDFGIAKAAADLDMTSTGEIMGTAAYLAPEQAMGLEMDGRADVYALGCVLFECLTGERPFAGDSPVQTASARIGVQVRVSERVAGIPLAVEDVVATAMAPEAEHRWPDGDAMAAALVAAGGRPMAAPLSLTPTVPLPRTAPRPAIEPQPTPAGALDRHDDVRPLTPPAQVLPHRTAGRRRSGSTMATVAALVVLLGLAATLALRGGDGDAGEQGAGTLATAGAESAATPSGAPLTGMTLSSFDPGGSGEENDGDVPQLTDGDAATGWSTVGYNTAAFGNLKPGVGILLDLGQEVDVAEVRLLGMTPGQSVELRSAVDVPGGVEDTSVLTRAEGLGTEAALVPDSPTTTRYIVVWLVPDLPPDDGRFRGRIGEIQVLAG